MNMAASLSLTQEMADLNLFNDKHFYSMNSLNLGKPQTEWFISIGFWTVVEFYEN